MSPTTKTTISALLDGVLFVLFAYAVGLTGLHALGAALAVAVASYVAYQLACWVLVRGPIYEYSPAVAQMERNHIWRVWSRGFRLFVFVAMLVVVFSDLVT